MSDPSDFNQSIIDDFRANGGKVGGGFSGVPLVLVTTKGAKSGRVRTTPLAAQIGEDGTIYVFATFAGAPKNPAWYHNMVAHPDIEVEFGSEKYAATATPLLGAERDRVFDRQKELIPTFADYEKKTARTIPVVALTHKGSA